MLVLSYVVGTVPFAWLVGRLGGADVRYAGSGNIGTANVLRTRGVAPAVLVLVLDVAKGAAAVLVAERLGADAVVLSTVSVAVVVGHVFPVWLKFHGGKGVATAGGAFFVLAPTATVVSASVFIGLVWATRYVSLGSIVAAALLPLLVYAIDGRSSVGVAVSCVAALILYRHRSNVVRLFAGNERRLGQRV